MHALMLLVEVRSTRWHLLKEIVTYQVYVIIIFICTQQSEKVMIDVMLYKWLPEL